MARRTPKPRGLASWQRIPSGSKKRKDIPSHVFYDQEGRRYPHKVFRDGKWVSSPQMEMAAMRRAILQGDASIASKARRDIAERRKKESTKK